MTSTTQTPTSTSHPGSEITDGAGELAARRRRLRFRCWHRGTREMDLLLGNLADTCMDTFDAADLDDLDRLLNASDPDLYNWISGREEPPAEERCRVLDLLIAAPPPAAIGASKP